MKKTMNAAQQGAMKKNVNEFATNGGVWVRLENSCEFLSACARRGLVAHGGAADGNRKYFYAD